MSTGYGPCRIRPHQLLPGLEVVVRTYFRTNVVGTVIGLTGETDREQPVFTWHPLRPAGGEEQEQYWARMGQILDLRPAGYTIARDEREAYCFARIRAQALAGCENSRRACEEWGLRLPGIQPVAA